MAMMLSSKENIKMFKNEKNISGSEKKNKKNVPHNITHSQEMKCFNKEYINIMRNEILQNFMKSDGKAFLMQYYSCQNSR